MPRKYKINREKRAQQRKTEISLETTSTRTTGHLASVLRYSSLKTLVKSSSLETRKIKKSIAPQQLSCEQSFVIPIKFCVGFMYFKRNP